MLPILRPLRTYDESRAKTRTMAPVIVSSCCRWFVEATDTPYVENAWNHPGSGCGTFYTRKGTQTFYRCIRCRRRCTPVSRAEFGIAPELEIQEEAQVVGETETVPLTAPTR